ncbi:MAG TPA: metallophosphoesterase [Vicinamibacterales bacterium]|nr:metallophosphoesterase [Vicinamibacterales bacterium]
MAVLFGALGDIHGDFASVRRIQHRHEDVAFWICVGDLADDAGRYEPLEGPLHWIKGNNENFDAIAAGDLPRNLFYLPNGLPRVVSQLTIAGLGGTLAPSLYEMPAAALPHPEKSTPRATALADRRRHFVREEVEACKALRGVDVFLTHEAPRPYPVGTGAGRRNDAGKTPVNEVLAAMQPRLHLFGHHHRFTESMRQGVRSVGLDLVSRSYLILESGTLEYEHRPT